MHVRHAELLFIVLHLPLIVDVRLRQLVLEEPFVVVPGLSRRTFRQSLQVFGVGDWLRLLPAPLRSFSEEGKVQTLNRLAAFDRQIRANAAFLFKS